MSPAGMSTDALTEVQFLLLQARDADDPMVTQEIGCFARALHVDASQIAVHDLISGPPSEKKLQSVDFVLLGGSGDYSVAEGGPWLAPAMEAMRHLVEISKPTFASCWGFQAMAKALGGDVITDTSRAELGSVEVFLTKDGKADPVFGPLGDQFLAPMGHQDCVIQLPKEAVLLASSAKVENQAFRIANKPIYCTQFHPELNRAELLQRVDAYPQYIQRISGLSLEEFKQHCHETVETNQLLSRFVAQVSRVMAK